MPARVEPVNETMSMSGWAASAAPTPGPSPLTRLNTTSGNACGVEISATIATENGASSLGLRTMVQPVARAGATLHMTWFSGQFHGVMKPQTPIGSLTMRCPLRSSLKEKPGSWAAAVIRWPRPMGTWAALARPTGEPISSVTAAAGSGPYGSGTRR